MKIQQKEIPDKKLFEKYLNRTGQTLQYLGIGLFHFGLAGVIEQIKKANNQNKKIVYYLAKSDKKYYDKISVRFITCKNK